MMYGIIDLILYIIIHKCGNTRLTLYCFILHSGYIPGCIPILGTAAVITTAVITATRMTGAQCRLDERELLDRCNIIIVNMNTKVISIIQ